jgi:hypothetical protein
MKLMGMVGGVRVLSTPSYDCENLRLLPRGKVPARYSRAVLVIELGHV